MVLRHSGVRWTSAVDMLAPQVITLSCPVAAPHLCLYTLGERTCAVTLIKHYLP